MKTSTLKRRALTKRYLALRSKYGYSASRALSYAKQPRPKPLDWNNNRDRAEWRQGGFDLVARVEPDDSPDVSYLGEFSTEWKQGAIKVDPNDAGDSRIYPSYSRYGERVAIYFLPCNSYQSHFKGLRAMGYGRAEADTLARSYVYQDMRRLRALYMGDWSYCGVIVTAYRAGIKLGDVSVWGIEHFSRNTPGFDKASDSQEYLTETARELTEEAIDQATNALSDLCTSRKRKGGK